MNRLRIISAAAGAIALTLLGAGTAQAGGRGPALSARGDSYGVQSGGTLTVHGGAGVLRNDSGSPLTIVANTRPANGTVSLRRDGTFDYKPNAGFTGTDTFTYTISDAVQEWDTTLKPLATIGGVTITGGAYGSSLYPAPGQKNEFYGLTDRGPNVDGPNGTKVEPITTFDPAIGLFRFAADGTAQLLRSIPLRAGDGTPYNGQVNCEANTGETVTDLNGTALPCSATGYDSEGLVALPDGTFWVSDEYGPYITHFDRNGKQIGRISPFDGSLPSELKFRVPNKGMEGLTITPDGSTLVGVMQSALQTPDLTAKPANVPTLRIVTYNLRTRATHEYLYLLDDPATTGSAVSEITALSNSTFLVDERDGKVEPGAFKKLFKIDLAGATDVGPHSTVAGATYDAAKGGLLVGTAQRSIDATVGKATTAEAVTTLAGVGVTPVAKALDVDLGGLVSTLDPTGGFFGHDKVEGVATTDHGRTVVVSNDSDFGISGLTQTATTPFTLQAKILPNGQQDDGGFLAIDTTRLTGTYTSTATVTIKVTSGKPTR
ncbi:esterase-like activity of phytase family protein [Pseudofrankia inefficax]|uniref:Phytase-like domain-containing protein n=1 Tax=Pseudofrankia inefficax (strain DSM 45817 / CECT 9037 / DDB 130130 / EuI1c) TaxID=298654 RepID=E3IW73_PSEI1|nr:esterase-like activity of phytase family protein [Pseudofrankia inefficax]ADP78915.1 hypothetical protein FraEuI1c_0837 [Pseudofrankia inefficax]